MAAEVLPSARWLYCGEPDESQRALLVQFSNGKLQNPGNMRFTLYKSNDSTNPRKRSQRILVSAAVARCLHSSGLRRPPGCGWRHFVGILNKTSGQMEVYDAELFNMQPLFSDESVQSESTLESHTKSFREKMDSCIEAFGTTKQKRALNSRRMNKVGSESLNSAVAKAAESIIDTKGVTAHSRVEETDVGTVMCPLCPWCQGYSLQGTEEGDGLKFLHCSFVIEALKSLPSSEESRDRQARCIWFLDTLIRFRAQKVIKRKSALGPGIPHIINTKLLKQFTCLIYNNGSLRNLISDSMKAKITAYVIILALHINSFQIDLTVLQRDLKLSEKRMMEIAKAMRLKISKRRVSLAVGREEDHKLGTLSIPLPPAQALDRQSKRRKIT
ncbi:DNA-directed RNA polymerase I subunit RPA49, partial [Eschrichtius robustus]|nr:DNA-directed RNA polymerase I subunit RPA49 [Eschrichtius robustus]